MKTGFYILEHAKLGDQLAFRCDCCRVRLIFAPEDKQPRAFCCGQWREYVKPTGFFAASLPREQFRQPRLLEFAKRNIQEDVLD